MHDSSVIDALWYWFIHQQVCPEWVHDLPFGKWTLCRPAITANGQTKFAKNKARHPA
jgi:hypothetical protein